MSRSKHAADFTMDQPIELLFPLFSAEGETLWVPDWEYENIMGSTELHEDYIFLTEKHDHASTKAVWLVKRYEPKSHYVQFYKVEPDYKVSIVTVQCTKITESQTRVEVGYEFIGLSEKGHEFIEGFTSEQYKSFIKEWKTLLLNYFNATC
jgi:hypothetical protein